MRIAYGIHGFGRGHATRASAILSRLVKRHEVLVLAGGDAYDALAPTYAVARIPTLAFYYSRPGRISNYQTFKRNLSAFLDLKLGGPAVDMVAAALGKFRAEVIISDSEPFALHAARRLGIPRMILDHFGLLVYCRVPMSWPDRLICWGDGVMYRLLYGHPQRAVVSGFFTAPPHRPGVQVVGPIIRDEIREIQPTDGDYLLAYFSRGQHEYSPHIERALSGLDCPVRVYGAPRQGRAGNLEFKPLGNMPFIEDLAGCRAVLATAGNQLIGETMYFKKPILALPMNCLEQRLNALEVERLGIGLRTRRREITTALLQSFLQRVPQFQANLRRDGRDGAAEAVHAVEAFMAELSPAPSP